MAKEPEWIVSIDLSKGNGSFAGFGITNLGRRIPTPPLTWINKQAKNLAIEKLIAIQEWFTTNGNDVISNGNGDGNN